MMFQAIDVERMKQIAKEKMTIHFGESTTIRIIRLLVVMSVSLILAFGLLLVYLIYTSDKIAFISAFLFASVLFLLSIVVILYTFVSPIFVWIWNGHWRWIGNEDEEEIMKSILFFAFLCLGVSLAIFYHLGFFVDLITRFVTMFDGVYDNFKKRR